MNRRSFLKVAMGAVAAAVIPGCRKRTRTIHYGRSVGKSMSLKTFRRLEILRRFDEAIAMDFIIPYRILGIR